MQHRENNLKTGCKMGFCLVHKNTILLSNVFRFYLSREETFKIKRRTNHEDQIIILIDFKSYQIISQICLFMFF